MADVKKASRGRKGAATGRATERQDPAGQARSVAEAARERLAQRISLEPDVAQFPADDRTDPSALAAELGAELRAFSDATTENPFSNPVLLLALDLSRRLEQKTLSYGALEQLVQHLSAEGFLNRAERFGRYLGETDPQINEARLRELFLRLAGRNGQDEGDTVSFDAFQARVEDELFGVVTTAHPTFNISGELMRALAALATGRNTDGSLLSPKTAADLVDRACRDEHRPDRNLDLLREHELSLEAIASTPCSDARVDNHA